MDKVTAIGIDPGLRNVGLCAYSYWKESKRFSAATSCIVTTGKEDLPRQDKIYNDLSKFFNKHSHADLVVIEGYDYKGFNTLKMAEISGIIKLLAHQLGFKVEVYAPASVKKFATGNSQAKKESIMAAYSQNNEHIADAMALADIGLSKLGYNRNPTRAKLEVLRNVSEKKTTTTRSKKSADDLKKMKVSVKT